MNKPRLLFPFVFLLTSSVIAAQPQKIVIKVQDATPLTALFCKPQKTKPTVVMLHGLASSKEEWRPLAAELQKIGWGWLAYDARGQGESSRTKDLQGAPDGYRYFGRPGPGSEWERMVDDVGAVIRYLEKTQNIDRGTMMLAGASVGANVCLKYATLTNSVRRVLLLSPGLNYQEIKPAEFIGNLTGASVLIVASPADSYAYASSLKLKEMSPLVELWTDVKPGHGVQMFDPKLLARIVAWLKK